MRHIVLIGLPGSGKTSLGKLAAARRGCPFVDVDLEIEKRFGMPIHRIFEEHGEEFFRDAESRVTREALRSPELSVIATGGGVILRPENTSAMREGGFVIFLDRPVKRIAKNVPVGGSRPLLTSPGKLRELERARRALYVDAADRTLNNDGGIEDAFQALMAIIGKSAPEAEYAVIGDPIAHSLSPAIHKAVFETLGLSAKYSAVKINGEDRGELARFFEEAKESGMRGFNVTRPHKRSIMPYLDSVSVDAGVCGAVNTVVFRGRKCFGHNTDMGGLLFSLRECGSGCEGRRVVILGAGGASRAAALSAARDRAAEIVILARDERKALEIASDISAAVPCLFRTGTMTPGAMKDAASGADLLINATPLGMSGIRAGFPSLKFLDALPASAFVCDLVYSPPHTALLDRASELGLGSQNGMGMLIYQAILADELFLGRPLDRPALYKAVSGKLTTI
ncbi:MAG: shikimate dehydrogenase [Synergistaceae bacterium]|jgi:shikimate dehydrogenase|nr:shikimate dehydrogenase [Synergistaceae bacterium]